MDLLNKFFSLGGQQINFGRDTPSSGIWCAMMVGDDYFQGAGNTPDAALSKALENVLKRVTAGEGVSVG